MKEFRYRSYTTSQTIEDVLTQLSNLDEELKDSSLHNLIAFNHTYLIITRNVYSKFGQKYFISETLMSDIDSQFGNMYFEALHNYVNGKTCPPAWKILFRSCEEKRLFQFLYMALGVNAHVNNDLAQTLQAIMKGNFISKDYFLINEVIRNSIHEVVISLKEHSYVAEVSKNSLEFMYTYLLNYLIQKWRNIAWEHYKALNANSVTVPEIESEAQNIALQLVKSRNLAHLPRVFFM